MTGSKSTSAFPSLILVGFAAWPQTTVSCRASIPRRGKRKHDTLVISKRNKQEETNTIVCQCDPPAQTLLRCLVRRVEFLSSEEQMVVGNYCFFSFLINKSFRCWKSFDTPDHVFLMWSLFLFSSITLLMTNQLLYAFYLHYRYLLSWILPCFQCRKFLETSSTHR